ncbi:nucleotidyltransferase family protein [Lysinibacillus sphaericus]|uniref:nucleotidyltransferase family protein n=1 Tax=Lysinibacillus sphaericus TaxID=1421 RepID=UPI003F79041F
MERLDTEDDLKKLIKADTWMMDILKAVDKLQLPDCWVCAGVIRSKVWDTLHEYSDRTPIADIDVIYFDTWTTSETIEKQYEQQLRKYLPNEPWSVKNQARMHLINNSKPYQCSTDGIAHFPETPTAIGMRLNNDLLEMTAPYGINHLVAGIVSPTPYFQKNERMYEIYKQRIHNKQWKSTWPKLTIFD